MSLTDTIAPNASNSKPLSFSNREEVRKGKELPEKDLFHKYILDKESQAAAGQNSSYQGQALEHDSEIHARQGMLTSHSNPGQSPSQPVKGNKAQSVTKDSAKNLQNEPDIAPENNVQPLGLRNLQPQNQPSQGKTQNLKSPIGQTKVPNQPVAIRPEATAKSQLQQHATDKASSVEVSKKTTVSLKQNQAQTGKQSSSNSNSSKSGDASQNGELSDVKSSDKGNNSGTQSDNSGNHPQQKLPQQELATALNEMIPQQQTAQAENFSLQQAAMASANASQTSPQASTYSGPVAQLAQQIFRLQENGGTSRVTLDMPDGQKLLVRFNVSPNNGAIKVRFATKSPELRQAIEKSWNHLRVEAHERGVELDIPEFDSEESLTNSF